MDNTSLFRLLALGLTLLGGCGEGPGASTSSEDVLEGRRTRISKWSQPKRVELLPDSLLRFSTPLYLSNSEKGPILFISTTDDSTTSPPKRRKLSILRLTGGRWESVGEIKAASMFHRLSVVDIGDGSFQLFWAADPIGTVPRLPIPESFDSRINSWVYTCRFEDRRCTDYDSLAVGNKGFFEFSEAAGEPGDIHVFSAKNGQISHIVSGPSGIALQEDFIGTLPSVSKSKDGLVIAGGRFNFDNDQFRMEFFRFNEGSYTVSRRIIAESEESVQRAVILESSLGEIHVAWYSIFSSGFKLYHSFSQDDGLTWSQAALVFEDTFLFTMTPRLIEDSNFKIHLGWSHVDSLFRRKFYHSILTRSGWRIPEEPFSQFDSVESPIFSVDDFGTISAMWKSDGKLFVSEYR